MSAFEAPFGGEISRFFNEDFPEDLRKIVEKAGKKDILDPDYPHKKVMNRQEYEEQLDALQIELAKFQRWLVNSGERIAIIFEGRDAAGKGGCIKRMTLNLNPRVATTVALSKPSDRERGQWYFQRYLAHMPTAGEMTIFDRSWYNRAGVEPVMGFCSEEETEKFFQQAPLLENTLIDDGVRLFKIWLTVSRQEQMRRFLAREADPLKHWKLSPIDVASLGKWHEYSKARTKMFERTHTERAPWVVIRSDDKRRARLAVIRTVLSQLDYDGKNDKVAHTPDPNIAGDPASLGEMAGETG